MDLGDKVEEKLKELGIEYNIVNHPPALTIEDADRFIEDSKLGLPPGTVSPFGLLNNLEKDVKVYVDEEIANEDIMCFHPNINTKTLFLKTKDLFKFFKNIEVDVEVILL